MDTPLPKSETLDSGYDADFAAWTARQAALLRAGRFAEADMEHIAEEIEDLGKSSRAAVSSQVRRIILHLMKLQSSPALDPRAGWRSGIRGARSEIEALLDDSPGLRQESPSMVSKETDRARREAEGEMADHGEDTRRLAGLSYTVDQVLGPFLPE